jgi:hypothetical protein
VLTFSKASSSPESRPIIYEAGDFVDDYAVDPELRNDWGLLFRLRVHQLIVSQLELVPVIIARCRVNLATGPEREVIAERITTLSAEMGTAIKRRGNHLWIHLWIQYRPPGVCGGSCMTEMNHDSSGRNRTLNLERSKSEGGWIRGLN